MPFGRSSQSKSAPGDVRGWRPQWPGLGKAKAVTDPVVEPYWEGLHVLAHLGGGRIELLDEKGEDWSGEFERLGMAIREAIQADEAIVDGFVTPQLAEVEPGADIPAAMRADEMIKQMIVGDRKSNRVPMPPAITDTSRLRFVAVDLLSIDGSDLLEVPLLERKRLLGGAVVPNGSVAVTTFVRAPADSFIAACRRMGFWAVVFKAANSRYAPSQENRDWAVFRIPQR